MKQEKKETTDEMVSLKVRTFIGLIISIITLITEDNSRI